MISVPNVGVFDYLTKDGLCIEWSRQNNGSSARLPLYLAVLDMFQITADCTEIEKKLILRAIKRKKNMIRRGNTDE